MPDKPNILVIWGDDIGITNLSCYSDGLMGYRTPNIDRIASEGMRFTDSYGEQSCTAGRAAFITGQSGYRTGLTKVGIPGATIGLRAEDPTIADLLKDQGYATGQFGKNHLGDRNEFLPTVHGFDEFFGNLYHLNAEEEPELPDYPNEQEYPHFRDRFGPRGVLHCWATEEDDDSEDPRWGRVGKQRIEDTGPLTKKRMETCDDEFVAAAKDWIRRQHGAGTPFFCWMNTTHMHLRTHTKPESLGQSGPWQSPYHDTMIDHDRTGSTSSASPRTRSSCTAPTTARTRTPGRTGRPRRSAARRTPTGRARSGCRWSCAGPERSRPGWSPTRSCSTTTGCPRSCPWPATRT
jgi:arylsulfatase